MNVRFQTQPLELSDGQLSASLVDDVVLKQRLDDPRFELTAIIGFAFTEPRLEVPTSNAIATEDFAAIPQWLLGPETVSVRLVEPQRARDTVGIQFCVETAPF